MIKIAAAVTLSLIFGVASRAQTARELYSAAPASVVGSSAEIVEETSSMIKLKMSGKSSGEFKLVAQSKGEIIVGLTQSDCDASGVRFWSVKGGKWSDVTARVLKSLGKADVAAIIRASPATLESLNQTVEIATFYKFATDSTDLELFARKQGSCEAAGRVYNYRFNGKRYEKTK